MNEASNYIGNELELFAHAKNWKNYWGKKISPFIGKQVLEVGAGMGTNTQFLLPQHPQVASWVCIEPDMHLASKIEKNIDIKDRPKVRIDMGLLKNLKTERCFDSILYIDVIEHIEDDSAELEYATSLLNDGGFLIILVPAHNYLFSDFDKAIGHYRRYNKRMLKNVVGQSLKQRKLIYLDAVGMGASIANKLFLKQHYPTLKQIKFWDRYLVKASSKMDALSNNLFGKSLLGVWQKTTF